MFSKAQKMPCGRCGREMPRERLYHVHRSFRVGLKEQNLCEECARRNLRISLLFVVLLLAGVIVPATLIAHGHGRDPLELVAFFTSLPLLIALQVAMLVLHEFAHAVAGTLVGMKVREIAIGNGLTLFTFRVGSFPVKMNAYPVMGICYYQSGAATTMAHMAAIMAGPALHSMICVGVAVGWFAHHRVALSALGGAVNWETVWNILFFVNFEMLLLNLIPWKAGSGEGALESDGRQLLGCVRKLLGR